jgi:hypothetical protein
MKKKILFVALFAILGSAFVIGCTDSNQTQNDTSNQAGNNAINKWGASPNITNYYEYQQEMQIYAERDNSNLILNAYLQSLDGSLRCLGKVKGFGIPYSTQISPPSNGTQPVREPNGLFPSNNTNADWVQLIDPKTGKAYVTFVEPNLIITPLTLPCKPLNQ